MTWWCTECGSEASTTPPLIPWPNGKPAPPAEYTSIDVNRRYNVGYCECSPNRRVTVVSTEESAQAAVERSLR